MRLLIFVSALHILHITTSFDIFCTDYFSQYADIILAHIAFAMQKLLNLMYSHLFIFICPLSVECYIIDHNFENQILAPPISVFLCKFYGIWSNLKIFDLCMFSWVLRKREIQTQFNFLYIVLQFSISFNKLALFSFLGSTLFHSLVVHISENLLFGLQTRQRNIC